MSLLSDRYYNHRNHARSIQFLCEDSYSFIRPLGGGAIIEISGRIKCLSVSERYSLEHCKLLASGPHHSSDRSSCQIDQQALWKSFVHVVRAHNYYCQYRTAKCGTPFPKNRPCDDCFLFLIVVLFSFLFLMLIYWLEKKQEEKPYTYVF